jgi:hypothetical protein
LNFETSTVLQLIRGGGGEDNSFLQVTATQLLIRLLSNTFIHYHLQPNILAGLVQKPWSDLAGRTAVTGQLDQCFPGQAQHFTVGVGGNPQAVTCLTQCIRDTLGLGKYNFDLGKRGYMEFLPRPD